MDEKAAAKKKAFASTAKLGCACRIEQLRDGAPHLSPPAAALCRRTKKPIQLTGPNHRAENVKVDARSRISLYKLGHNKLETLEIRCAFARTSVNLYVMI